MYRALDGVCTRANSKAHHITMVKQFYSITNKKDFLIQICLHNSRKVALIAADHKTVCGRSQPSTTANNQERTYTTKVAKPLFFKKLRWSILGVNAHSTKLPLSKVAAQIDITNFTHAAAVFVRHHRQKAAGQPITSYDEDRLEIDASWVGHIRVTIHPSIRC
jgi:hypothetical protein